MKTKTPTYKSPSSFPHFEPHVTLATVPSSMSHDALRAAIPAHQPAVPVSFKSVEVGDKYFMSVYVTVHHSGELDTLREALKASLGEKAVPPVAHVSLFYIDDSEPEERTRAFDILRKQGRIVEKGEGKVALDCYDGAGSTGRQEDVVDGFDESEIWIAVCDGPVETWEVTDRIKLPKA